MKVLVTGAPLTTTIVLASSTMSLSSRVSRHQNRTGLLVFGVRILLSVV